MAKGEGPGWHRESRPHHDAALKGKQRKTHSPRSVKKPKDDNAPMDQDERRALFFAIKDKIDAYQSFDDPDYDDDADYLRDVLKKLEGGASLDSLSKYEIEKVESALEMTLEDLPGGDKKLQSFMSTDHAGFEIFTKKDLKGALAHVRKIKANGRDPKPGTAEDEAFQKSYKWQADHVKKMTKEEMDDALETLRKNNAFANTRNAPVMAAGVRGQIKAIEDHRAGRN